MWGLLSVTSRSTALVICHQQQPVNHWAGTNSRLQHLLFRLRPHLSVYATSEWQMGVHVLLHRFLFFLLSFKLCSYFRTFIAKRKKFYSTWLIVRRNPRKIRVKEVPIIDIAIRYVHFTVTKESLLKATEESLKVRLIHSEQVQQFNIWKNVIANWIQGCQNFPYLSIFWLQYLFG